jgi:hypothetical protein
VERGGRQRPLEERQGRDTEPQGGVRHGGRCSAGGWRPTLHIGEPRGDLMYLALEAVDDGC